MLIEDMPNLQVGDEITFRSQTRYSGNQKLRRVINGFSFGGNVTVRAHGYSDFVVRPEEIESFKRKG